MQASETTRNAPQHAHSAWSEELVTRMRQEAREAGFDLAGVAACPAAEEPQGRLTAERFEEWIAAGSAGEMDYLKRTDASGDLLRKSARGALPWARSIVVCAFNYQAEGPRSIDREGANTEDAGWIARYAWNGDDQGRAVDYHDDLMLRLQHVKAWLCTQAQCETRCYVDTGPLLERDFAARAGIGWIGKNTCVLNQQLGSWILLGVIVTSLPMAMTVQLAEDRCGTCTRCIDACPTNALTPRVMDASLCIAYLNIEKKGSIAEELREPMGRQVFGCDICQEVCPWNRKVPAANKQGLKRRDELVNPSLEWLASLDRDGFKSLFAGSPLERTKLPRLQRNVAIAMGNSGQAAFLPQLERWHSGEDAVLAEAAGWALRRLRDEGDGSASIVRSEVSSKAFAGEEDELVESDGEHRDRESES
jgi:epoxyqueuosine reductase